MVSDIDQKITSLCYRPKKIAVCTAWGSPFTWTTPAYNMANWKRPDGIDVRFFPGYGRDPAARHSWGVNSAIKWGATHIMFFGADQVCDGDILVKFVKHLEDGWSMVTGITPARGFIDIRGDGNAVPFPMVAWKWKEGAERRMSVKSLEPIEKSDGPYQECAIVGSGAIIFPVELIQALKKPWFREMDADDDGFRQAAMDTTWCYRMVTEAGGRMLCDLTVRIRHLDIFPIDETFSERFADLPVNVKSKDYFAPQDEF